MSEAITIADVRAAQQRLTGHTLVTPLLESTLLNKIAGRRVLVKAECLQKTGSFKFRGGMSAVSHLSQEQRDKGVIAFSSGNHAQGVALACHMMTTDAVIIMPNDAPKLKLRNTASYGAEVVLYDRPGGENREELGAALAEQRGLNLIKPYDHPQVMAGQGTAGLEIAAQTVALGVTDADVLICCGGGGLTSGIAIALEADAPGLTARPIEPSNSDDVIRSQISGQRESNDGPSQSICDAIVTPSPGELTFPIINRLCKQGIAVSDEEALKAMAMAITHLKVVAEPGGAVGLAAALYHGDKIEGDAIVCVISGGNADPAMIARAMSS